MLELLNVYDIHPPWISAGHAGRVWFVKFPHDLIWMQFNGILATICEEEAEKARQRTYHFSYFEKVFTFALSTAHPVGHENIISNDELPQLRNKGSLEFEGERQCLSIKWNLQDSEWNSMLCCSP